MTTNMITVKQLTYKRNRKVILDDLNLDLVQGHFIGLLGANGAGKTTLMRLLNGVATTFHGTIQIGSSESIVERKQLSSFSESLNGVNPNRTLKQIATYYADMYLDFSEAEFANFLKTFDLDSHQKLAALSKGNRKKLIAALTLARQTQLYLLDEPFEGIDSMTRKRIISNLIAWKPAAATVIISDHHVSDVANVLDEVVIIKDKHVVAQKMPKSCEKKPAWVLKTIMKVSMKEVTNND
ncbi:ABC transporter ATPase [Lacticaseibacillus paracasei subsp. paracasei Lpp126]|uniref:ABC transporter ATPase n=1 Tax=Lacticaseibacillus paracasei subsp. paracasei Lpp126 TaxID=1256206 RepID=S2RYF0_LACPA|nr:ABC transporter ATPase [Lacticaseibacillus paracasei subsp. paracasei Lpp126]